MDKEEKLCIKILQTLREMLDKKESCQDSVSTSLHLAAGGGGGAMSLGHGFIKSLVPVRSRTKKSGFCKKIPVSLSNSQCYIKTH